MGGVIIKKGTAPAPPSGGGESGHIIKPNGRYWKLNFITEETITNSLLYNSLNEEQQYAIHLLYLSALGELSSVYTCVGQKVHEGGMVPRRGIYYTTYGKIQSNLGYSVGRMMYDSSRYDLLSCFAWQEAYPNLPSDMVEVLPDGVEITGIFDYVKFSLEADQGQILSDEEVYAMMSEMLMIEPITKGEYENFVSNAENEDY